MFKLQTPDARVEQCDSSKFFINSSFGTYDKIKKMYVCDTSKQNGKLTLLKGCNMRYENENCKQKLLKYKSLQNYSVVINKIYDLLNHTSIYVVTRTYEYEKLLEFDKFIINLRSKIKLFDNNTLFILFSYIYLIYVPVSQEGKYREEYRQKCLCVYDQDHEGRINLLHLLTTHLSDLINMIGECIYNKNKLISSYITRDEINISKLKISNISLTGLYYLSQIQKQISIKLDLQEENELKIIFSSIYNFMNDIITEVVNQVITNKSVYVNKNGIIDFTIIKTEIGNNIYDLLKTRIEDRLNISVQVNIKYLLEDIDTYQDGRGSIKKENGKIIGVKFDEPELIEYIEEERGLHLDPIYFSYLINSIYKDIMYKTCVKAFWKFDKSQLEELCRIVSTLSISEEIKNEIQTLCNALNTKEELKKMSTVPIVKSEWGIRSRTYQLTNGKPASGNLKEDIEYIDPEKLIELFRAIKERIRKIYNQKRKREDDPELEF